MESKEIGTGAFGVFTRELVEANHLWQANGGVNVQRRRVARKVLNNQKMGAQGFEKVKRNLEQFKKCLSSNKNIMLNFITFIHNSQFNIISDLANLDLLKFLTRDY